MLSVALLGSFVQRAEALQVHDHYMALSVNSDGTPNAGNLYMKGGWAHAGFSTQDEEAYVWMNATLDEQANIIAQWCFPNGSIYHQDEKTVNEGLHLVWFSISIKNHPPANVPGMWKVEVFAKNTPLFTEEFIISKESTYPWSQVLSITGLVVAVIAGLGLLVFLRMKRPPPKPSFVLSLVGGLLIAGSAFFRGALGGEAYVYSSAFAVFLLAFLVMPSVLLGIAILVGVQVGKGTPIIVLSIISLVYFAFIYGALISGGGALLYALPFALAIGGGVCALLGGFLIRRKK